MNTDKLAVEAIANNQWTAAENGISVRLLAHATGSGRMLDGYMVERDGEPLVRVDLSELRARWPEPLFRAALDVFTQVDQLGSRFNADLPSGRPVLVERLRRAFEAWQATA